VSPTPEAAGDGGGAADGDDLRRRVQAMAAANRRLASRLELAERHRRAELGDEWIATLRAHPVDDDPRLVKADDGTIFLVEGGWRRAVKSGLIATALERLLGPHLPEDEGVEGVEGLAALEEGPPVEVFEAAHGAPFVIVGGQRLGIRGLPLPHPLGTAALSFDEGPGLDLGSLRPVEEPDVVEPASATALDGEPLPTFLIIGAQKSATRWLRTNLDAHPEIFTAPGEPGFFNDERRWKRGGLSWYRQQFEGWRGEPFVGESTPGYLMYTEGPDEIAHRIASVLPDVRLVAILRNPIDRARSAMVHHVVKGRITPETDLVELVKKVPPEHDQLGLIAGGWYAASLRPYLDRFGDRLLVLLYDDLLADPEGTFRRALGHVGASRDHVPAGVARIRQSQEGLAHEVRPLTFDDRVELYEYFRDDLAELEKVLGRSLAMWAPVDGADELPEPPE
jgi:hypothetical protein